MASEYNRPVTEEEWEMEIRRDEGRINRYFRKLPACIDLPDEEEFLFEDIADIPEFIPQCVSPEDAGFRKFSDSGQDCECKDEENCQHSEECVIQINALAVNWSLLCIENLSCKSGIEGLGINCSFAKLLARVEEFNSIDTANDRTLKISVGKRVLKDIDSLTIRLSKFSGSQESSKCNTSLFTGKLNRIRAIFISKLKNIKAAAEK